ncbi:hypothetical protein MJ579_01265 [Klebsiella pneumoniae]|nr:hypothetical protein MJ579_01265 [Klebsiella pneumoniae]
MAESSVYHFAQWRLCRAGSEVFRSPVSHYRMRAEFRLARWRRSVPYYFRSADPVADSR